jgi:hypothetical protein
MKNRDENKNDRSVLFFNFGNSCGLRLLISMYTLRKYYSGSALLLQQKNEENTDRLIEMAKKIGIEVELMDLEKICDRNFKSVLAPKVLKISPYETSIQIDSDTSFRASPQQILDWCHDYGVLVSHFNNWISSGKTMAGRINSFADVLSAEDLRQSLSRRPAVNCGVVGYRHGMADDFQKEWDDLTNKTAGRFIAEEIACQCVFWKYPHYLAPPPWNTSVRYGNLEEAKIIHYHGSKHAYLEKRNSRYWWAEVGWAIEDGITDQEEIKFWIKYDKRANEVFSKNGLDHIIKVKEEFSHLRVKKDVQ